MIGVTIALLPLYNRITQLDFNRTSKDNLLVVLFGLFCFILPGAVRKMTLAMYAALIYGLFFLVMNQWNVLSVNVMFQVFYISAGLLFFANLYEKFDRESTHFILKGMVVGALIQSTLSIPAFFGFEIYPNFTRIFSDVGEAISPGHGQANMIGSLGNSNLLASYLALTSMAFLSLKKLRYLVIIPIVALLMSGSMMGIGAFFAGVSYYLNIKYELVKKWQIYLASSVAMVTVYFTGLNGADSGRFEIWYKIFDKVTLSHFLIGRGPGWFADQKLTYDNTIVVQEHSNFITFFNLFGIFGIILVLPIFLKFLKAKDDHAIFSSILFVAFCNSYGHFSLHQSTTAIIIIVTAAICLAGGKK